MFDASVNGCPAYQLGSGRSFVVTADGARSGVAEGRAGSTTVRNRRVPQPIDLSPSAIGSMSDAVDVVGLSSSVTACALPGIGTLFAFA